MDSEGCSTLYNYDKSYRRVAVNVVNYPDRYRLSKDLLKNLKQHIGEENYKKIVDACTKVIKESYDPVTQQYQKAKFKPLSYPNETRFKEALSYAQIEGYNGKSKEETEDFITQSSKRVINKQPVNLWMKNVNPDDIKDGNDLPDINIARRVMQEDK